VSQSLVAHVVGNLKWARPKRGIDAGRIQHGEGHQVSVHCLYARTLGAGTENLGITVFVHGPASVAASTLGPGGRCGLASRRGALPQRRDHYLRSADRRLLSVPSFGHEAGVVDPKLVVGNQIWIAARLFERGCGFRLCGELDPHPRLHRESDSGTEWGRVCKRAATQRDRRGFVP
jgi:hypothetical protein